MNRSLRSALRAPVGMTGELLRCNLARRRREGLLHLAPELHGGQRLIHRHIGVGQRLAGLDRLQQLDVVRQAERQAAE
jgi:hypothetical protein